MSLDLNCLNKDDIFKIDVRTLTDNQLQELVKIFLRCVEVEDFDIGIQKITSDIKNGKTTEIDGISLNIEILDSFVKCIEIIEKKVDNIVLLPPEMRFSRIKSLSEDMNLEPNVTQMIFSNWFSLKKRLRSESV